MHFFVIPVSVFIGNPGFSMFSGFPRIKYGAGFSNPSFPNVSIGNPVIL